MVLNNVKLVDAGDAVNVEITGNKITCVGNIGNKQDPLQLHLDNANIYPGLINSHDHLDFNLFPQLGNRFYKNYTEWGKNIHEQYKEDIAKVLKVPLKLREQWGVLKNLICGVTTVVNHGQKITITDPLITVYENYYCIHSVGFEKRWKLKLNNPFKLKHPVVMHAGEGTDLSAYNEINLFTRSNYLRKQLIAVHAVAMSDEQATRFKALIWCPQSNYFLLGETAAIKALKAHTTVLFGTDSTLTGNWNIWDHISLARKTKLLTDKELYNSLNKNAINTWKTTCNEIATGNDANLFVTRCKIDKSQLEAFFTSEPKDILLVVHQGNIRLFDASLYDQLTSYDLSKFSKIKVGGTWKYVEGDVPGLMTKIKGYYPAVNFPVSIDRCEI